MNAKQLAMVAAILVTLGVGFWQLQAGGSGAETDAGAAPEHQAAAGPQERSSTDLTAGETGASGAVAGPAREELESTPTAVEPGTDATLIETPEAEIPVGGGIALRCLNKRGTPLANRQLVAALEVAGGIRPSAEYVVGTDGEGRASFEWEAAWANPGLLGVHFTVLPRDRRYVAGETPPPSRPGPQVFVELGGFGQAEPQQLSDRTLLSPADRFPVPLLQGRAVSSAGGILESLWGDAFVPQMADSRPARGGLELRLLGDGAFEVFGPAELETVELRFTARDHLQIHRGIVETPAIGIEVELMAVQRLTGELQVPEPLDPRGFFVWMASEEITIGITVAPDGEFEAEGQVGEFQLSVSQGPRGWTLWLESYESVEGFNANGGPGTIDLRSVVEVVEVEVIDLAAASLTKTGLDARLDGEEVVRVETDESGALLIAVPLGASSLELRLRPSTPWETVPLGGGRVTAALSE